MSKADLKRCPVLVKLGVNDYEAALEQSDITILHYDIKTKTLTIPKIATTLHNVPTTIPNVPESLIDTGLIVGDDDTLISFFEEIHDGIPQIEGSTKLRTSSGEEMWVRVVATTFLDNDKKPSYAIFNLINETAQRQRAFEYQKWEPTIRTTIASCLYFRDQNLSTDTCEIEGGASPHDLPFASYSGFDEYVRAVTNTLIHPDDRDDYLRDYSLAAMTEHYHTGVMETRTIHRRLLNDGSYLWCERIVQLFTDPYSYDIHAMIMIRKLDDTLAKMQQELTAGAHELISASVPGGIIGMYNKPGYPIYYINDHMLSFLDYTHDEFMSTTDGEMSRIIHPDDYQRTGRAIAQAIRKQESFELQIRIIKSDGQIGWVIIRGKKNESIDSNINLLMCHFTDITRMISLQEELQQAAAAAAEASKMKSVFLANMSHEIRTPMNGILGFVELALAEPNLNETVQDYMQNVKTSTVGLLGIVNDILDISKIEAGKMRLEHVSFSLDDIFTHCENINSKKAKEKRLELIFTSDAEISTKLVGDPNKLTQILINLLSNAVKFTHKGFVRASAKQISSIDNIVEVQFTVEDSGIGMNREQLNSVFAPFVQADQSTTRKYGGTGLGLTICNDLVKMMGGTMKVDSELGKGSSFSFTLTLEATDEEVVKPMVQKGTSLGRPRFSGQVLVCEDNVINQQVVVAHLARIGLKTTIAANGQVAVDLVTEQLKHGGSYDVILMDIHMPIMDGIEATVKLLSMGITTPIIAMTANAMKRDRESYLAMGMSDYISKPFFAQDLWACLLKYLDPLPNEEATAEEIAEEKKETPADMVIDHELGLKHADNDEELYGHLKQNFFEENKERYQEIIKKHEEGETSIMQRILHSLKSNAGWIGATKLSQIASELELHLKNEQSLTDEHLEQLKTEFDKVISELKP
ncbi:MAG: response regulator [Lachnospiraceae bacterium]|jgi:signal transduction histidine kinase/DNA-binding response OmpR family regulator|nr:response regulator [Lachnospiraceae bacterium]